MNYSRLLEKKIMGYFGEELKKPDLFSSHFGAFLENNCKVEYNFEDGLREFDILILGKKRLGIGLLTDKPYNIEIEANVCNNKIINNKCSNDYLYSIILNNGTSSKSYSSKKVYSFIDSMENFVLKEPFDGINMPSIKNPKPFLKEVEHCFAPRFMNNHCDFLEEKLGFENINNLEMIMNLGIECNLKKGILYFLSDNILKKEISGVFFMPQLMQANIYGKSGHYNLIIDSGIVRDKIKSDSLSRSYETYLRTSMGKKLSKGLCTKNFCLATLDDNYSPFGSEITKEIVFKKNVLQNCFGNYVDKIKNF